MPISAEGFQALIPVASLLTSNANQVQVIARPIRRSIRTRPATLTARGAVSTSDTITPTRAPRAARPRSSVSASGPPGAGRSSTSIPSSGPVAARRPSACAVVTSHATQAAQGGASGAGPAGVPT